MGFEVFTREFVRSSAPKVTITNLGRFSINNGATALLKTHAPTEWVLLLWDKITNQIAIQPTKKGDSRAYPLKAYGPKGRSGTGFSAVTFLKHIKYDFSKTHSYSAQWDENMLMIAVSPALIGSRYGAIEALAALADKSRKVTKKQE